MTIVLSWQSCQFSFIYNIFYIPKNHKLYMTACMSPGLWGDRSPPGIQQAGLKVLAVIGDFKSFSEGKKQWLIHISTQSTITAGRKINLAQRWYFHTWSRLKPLSHLQSRWMKAGIFALCKDYVGHCIWKHNLILATATHYNPSPWKTPFYGRHFDTL